MSTRGKGKSTRGKSIRGKSIRGKGKSTTTREKSEQGSSTLKGEAELAVGKGRLTLGKLEAGAEIGVKEDKQGSGKIVAGINLGLKTDALDEIKEAADDTFDNIKSGLKTAGKKISEVYGQ